ncbi:MAG TPA: hypothetical protein DDY38_04855, partial [Firmicutes bacterium]|nr:hypothetical protein [Bacillota bacterium]
TVMLQESGYAYEIRMLANQMTEANKLISQALGIPLASPICEIHSLLSVEGDPKAIKISYIPYQLAAGLEQEDLNGCPLYQLLKSKYGLCITDIEENILVTESSREEQQLLGLEEGAEVMAIDGLATDQWGTAVESYQAVVVTDFFIFRSVTTE